MKEHLAPPAMSATKSSGRSHSLAQQWVLQA